MFLFFFEYLSFLLHDDRDALRDGVWRDLGWGAEARHEGRVHVRFPSAVYYYTTADTYLTVATNHTREKSCWPHVRSPMQHILPTHTYAIHISQTFFLPTLSRVPRTTGLIIVLFASQFVPSCASQLLHSRTTSPLRLPHHFHTELRYLNRL